MFIGNYSGRRAPGERFNALFIMAGIHSFMHYVYLHVTHAHALIIRSRAIHRIIHKYSMRRFFPALARIHLQIRKQLKQIIESSIVLFGCIRPNFRQYPMNARMHSMRMEPMHAAERAEAQPWASGMHSNGLSAAHKLQCADRDKLAAVEGNSRLIMHTQAHAHRSQSLSSAAWNFVRSIDIFFTRNCVEVYALYAQASTFTSAENVGG